jgi:hypothetical protein
MNLKRAIYHFKHPTADYITAWWAFASFIQKGGGPENTKGLTEFIEDTVRVMTDAEGNSLLVMTTQIDRNTDVSKLSLKVLGD